MIGSRRLGIRVQLSSRERKKGAGQLKEARGETHSRDAVIISSEKGT